MIELCKEMNHEKWDKESETFNAKFKDSEKGLTSTENGRTGSLKSFQLDYFL